MRAIYYSLVLTEKMDVYCEQWWHSISSLRKYNRAIPVYLFVFNDPPRELREAAERYEVVLHPLGAYRDRLTDIAGRPGEVLSAVPTLHKLLPLEFLPADATQVLYLDCDTFFFADVVALFADFQTKQWYTREEPGSRKAALFPYDPDHIDEDRLRRTAAAAGCEFIAPCNSGVVLMNQGVWKRLFELRKQFLDFAWMLTLGASREPGVTMPLEIIRNLPQPESVPPGQYLEYPSQNYWILEQIALWLTLGRLLDGCSCGFFPHSAVLQDGEFKLFKSFRSACTVAHYFTGNQALFFQEVIAPRA